MARTLAFMPAASPNGVATVSLDDIPADVRAEVEEAYVAIKANPTGRIHAEFDDKKELDAYVAMVTSYCVLRPAGTIRFRKSPTKGLPENQMDFKITDLKTENELATEAVREATAAANAASGAVPVKAVKKAAKAA